MLFTHNATKKTADKRTGLIAIKKVLLSFILASLSTSSLFAADLSFSPSQGTYEEGKTFVVDVYVSNNTENINGVSGTVTFPANALSVRSVSKEGSIIKLWPEEPSYSNTNGTIKFEGVILNPGFSGARGKVISITFNAKSEGTANTAFSGGEILANDGNATNVLKGLGTASFKINGEEVAPDREPVAQASPVQPATQSVSAPVITSATHANENAWYSSRDVSFAWSIPSGVTAVRTLYDAKPNTTPSRVYEPPVKSRSFTTDEDGIMYMHVQFRDGNGWGTIAHRKFQIDTVAPKNLAVTLPDGEVTTNATPSIMVKAEDSLSGIDRVTVSIDGGVDIEYPANSSNLYKLPKLASGKHSVTVSAYDKASNAVRTTISLTLETLDAPTISHYTKQVEYGDDITVSGVTYPRKTVEVSFVDEDKHAEIGSVRSNDDGTFIFTWNKKARTGVYEMSARVVDASGTASDWTEGRLVVVENLKLIRIGMFIMNWLSLLLIIILASALVIATFWYSFLQFARFRRKIHRTMKEAEDTLKMNVQALRRDTEEFHSILLKAEKKRELTKEEQAILKKFKKRLDITEKEIEKKLEQIG